MSIDCASSAVEPKITTATTVAATTTTATAKITNNRRCLPKQSSERVIWN